MNKILLSLLCFVISLSVRAQHSTYINTTYDINAGQPVIWYGDVTFGPQAVVYLEDGATAVFYGKNMIIDPGAKFIALPGNSQIGTGTIVFKGNNPLYSNYPQQQTLNGGASTSADPALINLEIDNPLGVSLVGNAKVANKVTFTNGRLYLNDYDLIMSSGATFANYNVNRHVVTNGKGLLTKEGMANTASFLFPISMAGLDFTPATVTNTTATRSISVKVTDYANSPANESVFATKGMDRTWQITSNISGTADIALQHNTVTNTNGAGTNEASFNNSKAFVTQQIVTGSWSFGCSSVDGGSPISITAGTGFTIPSVVNTSAFFTKKNVECTDLAVTKTVNNLTPLVGSTVVFTVTARNVGAMDATGVKVDDLLPSGFTHVSSLVSVGSYDYTTGAWSIGSLPAGASATLSVTATIRGSGNYTNTAVIGGDQSDNDLSNNTASAVATPGAVLVDLSVQKTVDNAKPRFGDNVVFTITAHNEGTNAATAVTVTDLLPSGYTFVNASISNGNYSVSSGIWNIGSFAGGATATLVITATVKPTGTYANTATITGSDPDPVPGNNSATVTPAPNAGTVDLSIAKTVTSAGTFTGDPFEYTIKLTNKGNSVANAVVVTDAMANQLEYLSTVVAYGTVDHSLATNTLTWNVGSLAAGATVSITIRVKSATAGNISNTAEVKSTDTDIDLTNNSSKVDKEVLGLSFSNALTPNGDGSNDTFRIPGLEAYPDNTLTIYNRLGYEVWRSNGPYRGDWAGVGLNGGTYYYVLRLKDSTGNWQTVNGWVTLIR